MAILFTFPGQGTQKAGMLAELNDHETGRHILAQASDCLNQDVLTLDTEAALQHNQNVQIALTICSYAYARQLTESGIKPDYVLGLSIGAFAAATTAGVLTFEDALHLVARRGELMAGAYPQGYGMAAVTGLSLQQVQMLIEQSRAAGHFVYVANMNTESQVVVSGKKDSLTFLCQQALARQATSARLLKVNVPSHCELLAPQAEEFSQALASVPVKRPQITYVSANAARVIYPVEKIREDLAQNMARQVHWWETVAMLKERGVTLAIEMKPGSVLTGLCKVSMPETISVAVDGENLRNLNTLAQKYG